MYIHKTVIKCYIPIHRTVSVTMADQIALEAELPFPSTPLAVLQGYPLNGGQLFEFSLDRPASQKERLAEPLTLGVYRYYVFI